MSTITYDGMEWGLEAFLDCYQFQRVADLWSHGVSEHESRPEIYMAVLEDGTLIKSCEARMLPWPQVLAFRPAEIADAFSCASCGVLTHTDQTVAIGDDPERPETWCRDCWDEAEW